MDSTRCRSETLQQGLGGVVRKLVKHCAVLLFVAELRWTHLYHRVYESAILEFNSDGQRADALARGKTARGPVVWIGLEQLSGLYIEYVTGQTHEPVGVSVTLLEVFFDARIPEGDQTKDAGSARYVEVERLGHSAKLTN
jgi:hypothetical protein